MQIQSQSHKNVLEKVEIADKLSTDNTEAINYAALKIIDRSSIKKP